MASVRAWNHYSNWLVAVTLIQAALMLNWISNLCKGVDVNKLLTLVPVLFAALLFFILLLKIAHEFYVQGLKPENVKEDEVFVIREKPKRFVVFILAVMAIFVSVIIIMVKQNSQIGALQARDGKLPSISTNSAAQAPAPAPKPLPDKIIPAPAQPPIVSTPQVATAETPKQFETNFPDTNDFSDPESVINKLKVARTAQQKAENEAAIERQNIIASNSWNGTLPIYGYTLEKLYNILYGIVATNHDGIAKTDGYFKCLPATLGFEIATTNIAEIRFQTNTKLDFKISIGGIVDDEQKRVFRITSNNGTFEIERYGRPERNIFRMNLHTPDADNVFPVKTDDGFQDAINTNLEILVDSQIYYLSHTNK
jgi:hypothetical protein